MSKPWKPSDFIVNGRYCDIKTILKEIDVLRRKTGSVGACLVVLQGATIIKSLLLISHESRSLQRRLQKIAVGFASGELNIKAEANPKQLTRLLLESSPLAQIVEQIGDRRRCRVVQKSVRWNMEGGHPLVPEGKNQRYFRLLLLLIEPTSLESLGVDPLAPLSLMAQSSAPVRVHRDLLAIADADGCIDQVERSILDQSLMGWSAHPSNVARFHLEETSEGAMRSICQALLRAAMKLTGCSVGNVYLSGDVPGQLRLVAKEGNLNPIEQINTDQSRSVVSWVYRRERPLLINDINAFSDSHPQTEYQWVGDNDQKAFAELAVPIRQRIAGSSSYVVLGVINVEKVSGKDAGDFSYHHLSLLRDIALRFCYWRSNVLFSLASTSLASLTRQQMGSEETAQQSLGQNMRMLASIPEDLLSTNLQISSILHHVHQITRSHSATVRLLSADGKDLIRFCAFPNEALHDGHPSIPIQSRKSVNAWVATKGKECYIPYLALPGCCKRFEGLEGVIPARRDVLSELCLPIFVSGRIIGTMNLESCYRDGYAETIHFARAIAEQVGLSVLRARKTVEEVIWSCTARSTINAHQLLKCVSKLELIEADLNSKQLTTIRGIKDQIRYAIEGSDPSDPPESVLAIIEELVREFRYESHVVWKKMPDSTLKHPRLVCLAFRTAMTMILENAHTAAVKSSKYEIRIDTLSRYLGGRRYLCIKVENNVLHALSPVLSSRLYRLPLSRERTHLGAFYAGAAMRAIGGEVYVATNDGNVIATKIDIPLDD